MKFKLIDFQRMMEHEDPFWFFLFLLFLVPLLVVIGYLLVTSFGWVGGCLVLSMFAGGILFLNDFFFKVEDKK